MGEESERAFRCIEQIWGSVKELRIGVRLEFLSWIFQVLFTLTAYEAQSQLGSQASLFDYRIGRPLPRFPLSISLHVPAERCDPMRVGLVGSAFRSNGKSLYEVYFSTKVFSLAHALFPAPAECVWRFQDLDRFRSKVRGTWILHSLCRSRRVSHNIKWLCQLK